MKQNGISILGEVRSKGDFVSDDVRIQEETVVKELVILLEGGETAWKS